MNPDTKEIPLTQGCVALVDAKDYDAVAKYKWSVRKALHSDRKYAIRNSHRVNGRRATILLHRQLMNPPPGMYIDHINRDGLDNRRFNLRICTNAQNQGNAKPQIGCSSIYKGVRWHQPNKKWQARIRMNGRERHLGYYDNEVDAAVAYNRRATELFGSFARLNVIPEGRGA